MLGYVDLRRPRVYRRSNVGLVKFAVYSICINADHISVYIPVLKLYSEMLFFVIGNVNILPDITINNRIYIIYILNDQRKTVPPMSNDNKEDVGCNCSTYTNRISNHRLYCQNVTNCPGKMMVTQTTITWKTYSIYIKSIEILLKPT